MLFVKQLRIQHPALPACWILALIRSEQTFDRHMSSSRANQALRSLANAGFQNRGVCLQAFPPFPSPSFIFCLSFHFSRGQNRESRSSVFLCSETARKRLLRRLPMSARIFLELFSHWKYKTKHQIWQVEPNLVNIPWDLISKMLFTTWQFSSKTISSTNINWEFWLH